MASSCQKKMMASCFQEHQQSHMQNPIFDALYCEEARFDDDDDFCLENREIETQIKDPITLLSEDDLFWDEDELVSLLAKEKKEAFLSCDGKMKTFDGSVSNEAVKWMISVVSHYGFNAVTAILAAKYYHRFVRSVCFSGDKPWMSQLAAVACVSIAAKLEETQVPLLLDFQVEESKYLFEAKTIQRMELLVLSTLQWKMNLATPMSFVDHITRRFELINNLHWDFLSKCNDLIISIIADCRILSYLPSVIAAATMILVIKETQTCCDAMSYQNQIMSLLVTNKEKFDECCKLIEEMRDTNLSHNKRRRESTPMSPSGIIDAHLSSEDSQAISSSSSSLEPLFKRSRA